jgi:hypothetical protein
MVVRNAICASESVGPHFALGRTPGLETKVDSMENCSLSVGAVFLAKMGADWVEHVRTWRRSIGTRTNADSPSARHDSTCIWILHGHIAP